MGRTGILLFFLFIGLAAADRPVSEPRLTVSPLRLSDLDYIIPLGNLNPPGHTFPTDHIYFCQKDRYQRYPVRAPLTAKVVRLHGKRRDCKVTFQLGPKADCYLGHVDLADGIVVNGVVKAGQVIGRTVIDRSLDLGLVNQRVKLSGFISPRRYPSDSVHADSPLKYFVGKVGRALYAKVDRQGKDKDGKIDYDRAGRLVGNWFHHTLPRGPDSYTRPSWAKHLSFVYAVRDPRQIRIGIGGTICRAGRYAVQDDAPDPATVTVQTGLVRYLLNGLGRDKTAGVMLVQLLGQQRLKIQIFPAGARPVGFDQRAHVYVR